MAGPNAGIVRSRLCVARALGPRLGHHPEYRITHMLSPHPIEFPEWLGDLAKPGPATRALVAGGQAAHVLEGVRQATDAGWLEPILVGPRPRMRAVAEEINWDIGAIELVEAEGEPEIASATASLAADPTLGMILKGHIHTNVLLGALLRKEAGIRTGGRLLHVWLLTHPDFERPLAISDGALNVVPDLETGKSILHSLIGMFGAIGRPRPRIALLAASEEVLEAMPATVTARMIVDWSGAAGVNAEVFGPVAMDVAIAPEAAQIKGVSHPAGHADALVVPSIEVGNVLAKALIWFRSACAAGVVLGGRIPITITSRSDAPAARLASVALARVLARAGQEGNR